MRHWPNREGVEWFCNAILPLVIGKQPDVRFHVVGPDIEEVRTAGKSIIKRGFVEDLAGEYRACDVFICPLKTGTGVKNKMLEAMASGCAIVSTSIGVEGLDLIHGTHLLIADDETAFADAVVRLIESAKLREQLGNEVRGFALRELSLLAVRERLEQALF
jgi:polysaccharide biosynthesis protein PslH